MNEPHDASSRWHRPTNRSPTLGAFGSVHAPAVQIAARSARQSPSHWDESVHALPASRYGVRQLYWPGLHHFTHRPSARKHSTWFVAKEAADGGARRLGRIRRTRFARWSTPLG